MKCKQGFKTRITRLEWKWESLYQRAQYPVHNLRALHTIIAGRSLN